jgi:hypothetical protein
MRLQKGSKVAAEQDLAWTKWVLDKQFCPTQDEEPKLSVQEVSFHGRNGEDKSIGSPRSRLVVLVPQSLEHDTRTEEARRRQQGRTQRNSFIEIIA